MKAINIRMTAAIDTVAAAIATTFGVGATDVVVRNRLLSATVGSAVRDGHLRLMDCDVTERG